MSRIGKIARRTFLVGSAAIAGGVAFGVYYAKKGMANPLQPAQGESALNPYVLIDARGVTLIAPRAEMGQGSHTTLAALVAEELDVAWEDIRVIHGPPGQAYYNHAMFGGILPFPEYSKGALADRIGDMAGYLGKALQTQITGGSSSMADGFEKMRHAGATARETLKLAAAKRFDLKASELKTENGAVIAPDGRRLTYVELAPAAAEIAPPDVDLRPATEWKYLGTSMPRIDVVGKSTGTAAFGIDTRLDGMVFAALRINPQIGGAMSGFDDTKAREMPGVIKIVDLGTGVAVVASNTWLAMKAAEAVEIDWETSPHPDTHGAIFDTIRAAFDTDPNSTLRDDGDADTLPEGATLIEAEYTAPYLAHATMEPMNATALFTGEELILWSGNQAPILHRKHCAAAVGLEPEAVTVHTPYMGGGFGRRGEYDYSVYAARVAKDLKGRPVQLTWSREEDMSHDFYRPGGIGRFRGAVKDGRAVLLDGRIAAQSCLRQGGARMMGFESGGPDRALVEGAFDQPYAIPNHRIRGHIADVHLPVGFWRSVGSSLNAFMYDSFLDEMAHAAGADPLDFRYQLMKDEHAPSAACLAAVREMSGWTGKKTPGIGRGVAFCYSFGTPVAQVIEVQDTPAGIRIARAWIACDPGIVLDPSIVEAQMIGGMIYGLSAAAFGEITFTGGAADQLNFPDYDALRMHTTPETQVRVLTANPRLGGVGEPGTPPSMPALANALFDLTGKRVRDLPLAKAFDLMV